MTLYVRQVAWLRAVPKGKAAMNSATARRTRAEQIQQDGGVPRTPPVPVSARALLSRLFEVGPVMNGGMGRAPLTYSELCAYEYACGVQFTPHEFSELRRLSREYVAESMRAEEHDAPPPWAAPEALDRDDIAARVRSIFGARAARKRH